MLLQRIKGSERATPPRASRPTSKRRLKHTRLCTAAVRAVGVTIVQVSAYSPEPNPVERLFRDVYYRVEEVVYENDIEIKITLDEVIYTH